MSIFAHLRPKTNDTDRVVVILITATRHNNRRVFDFIMSSRGKLGIACALIFVAIATAPVAACLSYLAQNTETHSCCPKSAPPPTVVPTCCIHSPAVTSHNVDVPVPMIASATVATDPARLTVDVESVFVQYQDTSPRDCSSVLRI